MFILQCRSPELDLSDDEELSQTFDMHSLIISSLQQEPLFTADDVITEIEGMMEVGLEAIRNVVYIVRWKRSMCHYWSPTVIGNFGGLLEGISMVAHQTSGNKMDNIMFVRTCIIVCSINHYTQSGSPITLGVVVNFILR